VTVRFLFAAAAFAAPAAFAMATDVAPSLERGWYLNGLWSVSEYAFTDGHKDCVLVNTQSLPSGLSAFGLNEFGGGASTIMFRDTTITWNGSSKSLTFQIDGNPTFIALAQTDTRNNILIVALDNTPSAIMGAFMKQLESGRLLLVTPSAGTPRTFELDGIQPALDAFGRCIAAMSSDGKGRH